MFGSQKKVEGKNVRGKIVKEKKVKRKFDDFLVVWYK
jgi:hypothetical protein